MIFQRQTSDNYQKPVIFSKNQWIFRGTKKKSCDSLILLEIQRPKTCDFLKKSCDFRHKTKNQKPKTCDFLKTSKMKTKNLWFSKKTAKTKNHYIWWQWCWACNLFDDSMFEGQPWSPSSIQLTGTGAGEQGDARRRKACALWSLYYKKKWKGAFEPHPGAGTTARTRPYQCT